MIQTAIDKETILQTFLEMVRISSPSGAEEPMQRYLIKRLEKLKALCPELTYETDHYNNLIAELPAEQSSHGQTLVFSGHMDVVPPCLDVQPMLTEDGDDTIITSDSTTVLGADDKAGLTPILEAVTYSLQHKTPRPKLRLLFTVEEEIGLLGAKQLDQKWLKADFAITYDHTGEQGVIIHKATSHLHYTLTVHGKSVHAGIMPEQGINAIVFAANILKQFPQGRIDHETTANIGKISGGKGTNVVPDLVNVTGEVRGHNEATIEKTVQQMRDILKREHEAMPGTDYQFEIEHIYTCYQIPPEHPGIHNVQAAMGQCGLTPKLVTTNGGSDNHIFVEKGLPGVVLSAAYVAPHSLKESVRLSDMITCTELTLALMTTFAKKPI